MPAGLNSILHANANHSAHPTYTADDEPPKNSNAEQRHEEDQKQVQQWNTGLENSKTRIDGIINGERAGCVHKALD